jgi:hypothetical protein
MIFMEAIVSPINFIRLSVCGAAFLLVKGFKGYDLFSDWKL